MPLHLRHLNSPPLLGSMPMDCSISLRVISYRSLRRAMVVLFAVSSRLSRTSAVASSFAVRCGRWSGGSSPSTIRFRSACRCSTPHAMHPHRGSISESLYNQRQEGPCSARTSFFFKLKTSDLVFVMYVFESVSELCWLLSAFSTRNARNFATAASQ